MKKTAGWRSGESTRLPPMAQFRFFWAVAIPGFCLLSVIVSASSFLPPKNLTAFLPIKRNRLKTRQV